METMTSYLGKNNNYSSEEEEEKEEITGEDAPLKEESCAQLCAQKESGSWEPSFFYKMDKEVHHFVGQDIFIEEAMDSFAASTWPAVTAMCQYLENHSQELDLVGKAVLEIGSGTGLVSIVAALLGAWVTATDVPEALSNLRLNLSRNTRGKCKHTPQAAVLNWSFDMESTYPKSVYHYDYVLAADVISDQSLLNKLLATMKHFCQPGTTMLWANKVRNIMDVEFADKFKETFNTELVLEDGDMRIFMATHKEGEESGGAEVGSEKEEDNEEERSDESLNEEAADSSVSDTTDEDNEEKEESAVNEEADGKENAAGEKKNVNSFSWSASVISTTGKDTYHYVGTDIKIYECVDFDDNADAYGAVMWPGALALCSFLENNRDMVDLQDKTVLELGSGTGLVAIVASLLGAKVTATDLPNFLGNLRANVMRNTRGRSRHLPEICPLTWSYDVGRIFPSQLYRFDYVLAADVVYHHLFLGELLATMSHFCQPRTTIIWANKLRIVADEEFAEKFKKEFDTTMLAEDGDMKIFMGKFKM